MSPKPLRELLLGMLGVERARDEISPDYSVSAGQLFLHGLEAGHWTATEKEIALARAPILARYGKEAFSMPESENKKELYLLKSKLPDLTDEDRQQYDRLQRSLQATFSILNNETSLETTSGDTAKSAD